MNSLPLLRDIVDEASLSADALSLVSDSDTRHEIAADTDQSSAESLRLLTFKRGQNDETPAGRARGSCGDSVDIG